MVVLDFNLLVKNYSQFSRSFAVIVFNEFIVLVVNEY